MSDVFISYSSKDKQVADVLCSQIEQQGYSCWIAPRDILPGEDWARSINTAITAAKVFIVIYSRNSCESSQVPKEIGIAGARNLSIIPYKIDDTPLTGDFEYYLLGSHWVAADLAKNDYKIADLTAAIERVVSRHEGREPSSVTINNNYAGDNNSVINVQEKASVGTVLKIAVVAAVTLLIVAIVIIVVLLTGREKEDNSSSQSDMSQNIITEEVSTAPETEDVSDETSKEVETEPLSYFEAEAIYNEMVHRLLQTASQNSYSAFADCFDETYTAAEIAEIYSVIGYSVEMDKTHISMYEFTDDVIFGMYTLYQNSYEGMPVHYHCDFVDEANVIVRYGDEWRFSRLSENHPMYANIEQLLYPYGPDTDDNYTVLTYQTVSSTVLCDHCMAEVVNVSRNEDDTVTVRFEIINGDYSFPSELNVSLSVYDYNSNLLLSMDSVPFDTNIASSEIQFYEITSEPLDYIDDIDLSMIYYDSYVHAAYG